MLGIGLSWYQAITHEGGGGTGVAFITISASSQNENTSIGTTIGTVSVVGGSGTYTFTKIADPDSAFTLTGAVLKNAISFDYETKAIYSVVIHADNGAGSVLNRMFSITVNNVDDTTPTITTASTASVAENATLSIALAATTDAAASGVTWTLVGGADQLKFEISGSTLRWASNGTKNFEVPDDANTDNDYVVQVRATSVPGGNIANKTITVTVTDVASPTITSASSTSVAENAQLLFPLTANETVNWTLIGGADLTKFAIQLSSTLIWLSSGTKNFESPDDANTDNAYVVQVRATSVATGEFSNQTITVTVTNVAETPVNSVLPAISGTTEAAQTLSVTDGTWTDNSLNTYTYQWKRDGVAIGAATNNTYLLDVADVGAIITCTVTATNSAGAASATATGVGPITSGGASAAGEAIGLLLTLTKSS